MNGKFFVLSIPITALLFGAGIYYAQVYAYYFPVEPTAGLDVQLVSRDTGQPEAIAYDGFAAIDATSSPIRYRACFTTSLDPALAAETYVVLDGLLPRNAPGWFECHDAAAIGAALEAGTARTFLSAKNVAFGVDRVVAITDDGRGYVWHELNDCGEKAYDGTVTGEACPERPDPGGGG